MELNVRLSPSQAKFALWIEQHTPYLVPLFCFDARVYREDVVERFLGLATCEQAIMARFVLGVWRGEDKFNFDFTEAASVLDVDQRKVIADWMLEPFWP